MSFKILKKSGFIIGEYEPQNGTDFIYEKLGIEISDDYSFNGNLKDEFQKNEAKLKSCDFTGIEQELSSSEFYTGFDKDGFRIFNTNLKASNIYRGGIRKTKVSFIIGALEDKYYKIPSYMLLRGYKKSTVSNDIWIHESIKVDKRLFLHDSKVLYFNTISDLGIEGPIKIGGQDENSIPEKDFRKILSKIPTRYGFNRYTSAMTESLFSEYLEVQSDHLAKYKKYLDKKSLGKGFEYISEINEFESKKYKFILGVLKDMLSNFSDFSEKDWQVKIIDILLILFPKYSLVLREVPIITPEGKRRFIDFMFVTPSGHVDVVEIKQPFSNCLLTANVKRNNYIPVQELSSTVVQVEKYIYYLNKWGREGERILTKKYRAELSKTIDKINIVNPKALLILGRSNNLSPEQLGDFEVIKRQYSNIRDIITYDDLINRLEALVQKFS